MDPDAIDYNENAEYHNGDCTYCGDDNDATADFGGCTAAVAALGCEFNFPFGSDTYISDLCVTSCNPELCAECEDIDEDDVCDEEDDCLPDIGGMVAV